MRFKPGDVVRCVSLYDDPPYQGQWLPDIDNKYVVIYASGNHIRIAEDPEYYYETSDFELVDE